jgi:hypothetical protein
VYGLRPTRSASIPISGIVTVVKSAQGDGVECYHLAETDMVSRS